MKKPVYNAQLGVPAGWLDLDEGARVELVLEHHAHGAAAHPRTSNPRVHAAMHVVVENQLASGEPPEAREALERLRSEGLDRHDAIHALGAVVVQIVWGALDKDGPRGDPMKRLREGFAAMTAERWRESLDEEG